mmetsp:Transcript_36947/g.95801  ORF Transcript_36947/g.95801 Transcript_36947/m.95801 type:complete len:137 (+) Transcript_36947:1133-1543(+)
MLQGAGSTGSVNVREFISMLRTASAMDRNLTQNQAFRAFILSNFEDEGEEEVSEDDGLKGGAGIDQEDVASVLKKKQDQFIQRWHDWDWEMNFAEFCEALVRCADVKFKERSAEIKDKVMDGTSPQPPSWTQLILY